MSIYGYDPNPLLKVFPKVLPRRKVFISYFKGDKIWADKLVQDWGQPGDGVFIPRAVGVREEDDFVNSDNDDNIISAIRDRYLHDTSATIVIIGRCTHSRKFVATARQRVAERFNWTCSSPTRGHLWAYYLAPHSRSVQLELRSSKPDRLICQVLQLAHDRS